MNGRIFYSQTLPNQNFRFKIPVGKYIGMLISLWGTNAGGATMANTDCGILTITKDGVQKYLLDFDIVQQSHNAQEMGAVENVSAVGAAYIQSAYIPFTEVNDEGVCLDVQNNNAWDVVLTAPNLIVTLVASGTIQFIGVKADEVAVSPYEIQMANHHLSPGAAGTFVEPIYLENPDILWIEKDAALSHLAVFKDGEPFVEYMGVGVLNTLTNLFTKTETYAAAIPYLKIDLNPSRDEAGNYSSDVKIQYTVTGATTIKMLVKSVFQTPDRLVRSVHSRNNAVSRKANAKAIQGLPVIAARLEQEKVSVPSTAAAGARAGSASFMS